MTANWRFVAILATLGLAPTASAADFVIVNTNAAGVGFNDPSPANPAAGGDTSGTLGQQRLAVFIKAAEQWGALLDSNVPIRVQAQMINQTCGAGGTVLGSAGPNSLVANFTNAPRPNTAYHIAHANALAGTDLEPAGNDLTTNFNLALDSGCSPGNVGWWYGTDPSEPVPDNRIPLLPVVFHEIGHGIGFSAQTNLSTGGYFSSNPPVWTNYLYDLETSMHWRSMNNAQRVASAVNDPDLVWTGEETNRYISRFLTSAPAVIVSAPAAIAGVYSDVQTASFGPQVPAAGVSGNVAVASPLEACSALTNAAAISGNIALVDRGTCNFSDKVAFAQAAGAIGVLVANNTTGLPGMGGTNSSITIPSLGITQALGNSLKANLPAPGVTLSMAPNPGGGLSGTRNGCMRMFAPNPVQSGSSVSHFTSDAFPNLLMEPALNRTIFDRVDLTIELFRDIGWVTQRDEMLFFSDFDPRSCDPLPLP